MRMRMVVAAVAGLVAVIASSASAASASPGARVAGPCQTVFSVKGVNLPPEATWIFNAGEIVSGKGAFCSGDKPVGSTPQNVPDIGTTPTPIVMAGVDDSTTAEMVWYAPSLGKHPPALEVTITSSELTCDVDGGGYSCAVLGKAVQLSWSNQDRVAPRVSAELLSPATTEPVLARNRLGVLVRTSEAGSIRAALVAARGGARLGTGRARALLGGERVFVSVRLTAAGRRALSRARGFARYRLAIRAVDRAGNVRRVRVPVR